MLNVASFIYRRQLILKLWHY